MPQIHESLTSLNINIPAFDFLFQVPYLADVALNVTVQDTRFDLLNHLNGWIFFDLTPQYVSGSTSKNEFFDLTISEHSFFSSLFATPSGEQTGAYYVPNPEGHEQEFRATQSWWTDLPTGLITDTKITVTPSSRERRALEASKKVTMKKRENLSFDVRSKGFNKAINDLLKSTPWPPSFPTISPPTARRLDDMAACTTTCAGAPLPPTTCDEFQWHVDSGCVDTCPPSDIEMYRQYLCESESPCLSSFNRVALQNDEACRPSCAREGDSNEDGLPLCGAAMSMFTADECAVCRPYVADLFQNIGEISEGLEQCAGTAMEVYASFPIPFLVLSANDLLDSCDMKDLTIGIPEDVMDRCEESYITFINLENKCSPGEGDWGTLDSCENSVCSDYMQVVLEEGGLQDLKDGFGDCEGDLDFAGLAPYSGYIEHILRTAHSNCEMTWDFPGDSGELDWSCGADCGDVDYCLERPSNFMTGCASDCPEENKAELRAYCDAYASGEHDDNDNDDRHDYDYLHYSDEDSGDDGDDGDVISDPLNSDMNFLNDLDDFLVGVFGHTLDEMINDEVEIDMKLSWENLGNMENWEFLGVTPRDVIIRAGHRQGETALDEFYYLGAAWGAEENKKIRSWASLGFL